MTTRRSIVRGSVVPASGIVKDVRRTAGQTRTRIAGQYSPTQKDSMASIQKNNRAAALLAGVEGDDCPSLERLAILAGISLNDLRACRDGATALPPDAQVRLARAIAARVPRLAPMAHRLEEQAAAALRMQQGSTALHLTAPAKWR